MRWQRKAWAVLGAAVVLVGLPTSGRAGLVTLAAGPGGGADPTAASLFWFDSMQRPPVVAVTRVSGGVVQATTGGGWSYFGGMGTPVVLDVGDGSAYLSGGSPPAGLIGGDAGRLASAAPVAGGPVPPGAAQLGLAFTDPGVNGSRALTVTLTGVGGADLGSGTLAIPDGGWWVIGLGPDQPPPAAPGPIAEPGTGRGDGVPPSIPDAVPGVPEPSTVVLAAVAGVAARLWRKSRSPAARAGDESPRNAV